MPYKILIVYNYYENYDIQTGCYSSLSDNEEETIRQFKNYIKHMKDELDILIFNAKLVKDPVQLDFVPKNYIWSV